MSSSSKATSAGNGLSLAFRLLSGRVVHDDLLRGCSNVSRRVCAVVKEITSFGILLLLSLCNNENNL